MIESNRSLMIIGSTVILVSLFIIAAGNLVFAVEYTNYTSEKYGIQFEYPKNWDITEKTSRHDRFKIKIVDPATFSSIYIYRDPHDGMPLKEALDHMLEIKQDSNIRDTKVIESPSISKIGNKTAGTFVITMKEYGLDEKRIAHQLWMVPTNYDYTISYWSDPEIFNSPENIEIRDHFINSIRFLEEDTSKTS